MCGSKAAGLPSAPDHRKAQMDVACWPEAKTWVGARRSRFAEATPSATQERSRPFTIDEAQNRRGRPPS